MQTEAMKKAKAKYDKANTKQIMLKLNLKSDKDILNQLQRIENKQGYIKDLIRKDLQEREHGRWIPVSKRLPKIGKEVLLSEPNAMFIAEYHGSGDPEGLWLVDGRHHYLADVNGCAWMPLPKPYKTRRRNE